MICSRRLYKGNSYEICLPLADSGVTLARFYTAGDVIIEKVPEITGDSMCFSFTEEEIASLPDGVLRYELVTEYETTDTNSPYVIVTPGDYSGSTLEDMLAEAFDSGLTACSGSNADLIANLNGDYYVIPEGTYRVRDAAFANTSMSSITIPSSVLEIKGSAFAGSGLISIDVPDTVTDFSSGRIFADCRNLQNAKLPNGVSALNSTFVNCLSLTGVTLPSGLTTLGQSVFEYCQSLSSITLPDSITSIGYRCFFAAKALSEITIPENVTEIGNMAFYACENLRTLYFLGSTPPSVGSSTLPGVLEHIYVPCGYVNAYKTALPSFINVIEENPECGE